MSPSEKTSPRVLIVEDDGDLRHLFSTQLTLAGFRVEAVDNGLAALQRIDEAPPDLLLLDLGLPVISGHSVANELAASALTRDIPLVVVTGQLTTAPPTNASCVLWKPVSLPNLIATVNRCLDDARWATTRAGARGRGRQRRPARASLPGRGWPTA